MSMKPSSRTQKSASVNSLQRDVLPQPVRKERMKKWRQMEHGAGRRDRGGERGWDERGWEGREEE